MSKRIEILDAPGGNVIRTIQGSEAFAKSQHPGRWQLAAVQNEPDLPFNVARAAIIDRMQPAEWQRLEYVVEQVRTTDPADGTLTLNKRVVLQAFRAITSGFERLKVTSSDWDAVTTAFQATHTFGAVSVTILTAPRAAIVFAPSFGDS